MEETFNEIQRKKNNDVLQKKFEIGDIVFVSNPDLEYEKEDGNRFHTEFFGKVTEVREHNSGDMVCVSFGNGDQRIEWSYTANELSLARVLKDLSLNEFVIMKSNNFMEI